MPAYRVKLRRGTTVQHQNFIGEVGEITVDTDLKRLVTHDGVTPGGFYIAAHSDIKTDVNEFTDNDAKLGDHTFTKQGTTIDTTTSTPVVNYEVQVGLGRGYRRTAITDAPTFFLKNVTAGETEFTANPKVYMEPGTVYIFDVSEESNAGHLFRFTDNSGTTAFTQGVVATGTPGSADAKVTFTYPTPAKFPLWYYCQTHGLQMGQRVLPAGRNVAL
jgi:hypothetical protein